jgi:hypothetical protein
VVAASGKIRLSPLAFDLPLATGASGGCSRSSTRLAAFAVYRRARHAAHDRAAGSGVVRTQVCSKLQAKPLAERRAWLAQVADEEASLLSW